MARELLPDRRKIWSQKAKIDGHTFHLSVGEYKDGRPGEIFLNVDKYGSFTRGMCDAFARMVSLLLQEGVPLEQIIKLLRVHDFPPNGQVFGTTACNEVKSVPHWISEELASVYMSGQTVEKVAGYIAEPWRSGV